MRTTHHLTSSAEDIAVSSESYVYKSSEAKALACRGTRLCLASGKGPCILQAVLSILTAVPPAKHGGPYCRLCWNPAKSCLSLAGVNSLGSSAGCSACLNSCRSSNHVGR